MVKKTDKDRTRSNDTQHDCRPASVICLLASREKDSRKRVGGGRSRRESGKTDSYWGREWEARERERRWRRKERAIGKSSEREGEGVREERERKKIVEETEREGTLLPLTSLRQAPKVFIAQDELRSLGAELHYTQRGGDITFHGPHQAILYPIISLKEIGLGARKYVKNIESAMIELASLYGVPARAGGDRETGVWVDDRRIGAIGVRISSGFTSHGLAFNIDPDMKFFEHIVPCGIANKDVTSLRRETSMELPADEVIHEQLICCFMNLFGYSDVTWNQGPPLFDNDVLR